MRALVLHEVCDEVCGDCGRSKMCGERTEQSIQI